MSIAAVLLAPIPAVGNVVAGAGLALMAGLRIVAHYAGGNTAAADGAAQQRQALRDAQMLRDRARAVEKFSPGYAADLYAAADRTQYGSAE